LGPLFVLNKLLLSLNGDSRELGSFCVSLAHCVVMDLFDRCDVKIARRGAVPEYRIQTESRITRVASQRFRHNGFCEGDKTGIGRQERHKIQCFLAIKGRLAQRRKTFADETALWAPVEI